MSDTKSFFNHAALAWDSRKLPDAGKIETMLALSDLKPHSLILDVGCGTGVLEPYLLKYRPARIMAVDFAEKMIDTAKKKYSDPRITFIHSDIFDVDAGQIVCDYCFMFNSFPHFPDQKKLACHLRNLLAPGSRLTISHTQGIRTSSHDAVFSGLPAQGIVNAITPYFRPDVIIDNNVMLMVSALALD